MTKEQEREVEEMFDWLEQASCFAETNHQFAFHDDGFRFQTCICKYLEVFYVRA